MEIDFKLQLVNT